MQRLSAVEFEWHPSQLWNWSGLGNLRHCHLLLALGQQFQRLHRHRVRPDNFNEQSCNNRDSRVFSLGSTAKNFWNGDNTMMAYFCRLAAPVILSQIWRVNLLHISVSWHCRVPHVMLELFLMEFHFHFSGLRSSISKASSTSSVQARSDIFCISPASIAAFCGSRTVLLVGPCKSQYTCMLATV